MDTTDSARTLYRPVGLMEAVLILEAGSKAFPPRRPDQPIFYPVLNRAYAEQIARDWNAPHEPHGFAGFVTEFSLDADYLSQFQTRVVGSATHQEIWVPSEQLEDFNRHLLGPIAFTRAFYGTGYVGPEPLPEHLVGRTARQQLPLLAYLLTGHHAEAARGEVARQRIIVPLNFAYWVRTDLTDEGLPLERKVRTLTEVRQAWSAAYPDVALIGGDELDLLAHGAS